MNSDSLVSFKTSNGENFKCTRSIFRLCGYKEQLQVLDEGQSTYFKKRQKVSLKNRRLKANNPNNIGQSLTKVLEPVHKYLCEEIKQNTNGMINHHQQMIYHEKSYSLSAPVVKPDIAPFKKTQEFIDKNQIYPQYTYVQKLQSQNEQKQKINYEEQFQKILFDQNIEIKSQTFHDQNEKKALLKKKQLKTFQISQCLSIYSSVESSKSSILPPYTQSFKYTASTFNQGKTSQSIIVPNVNTLQTKSAVSEAISDDDFETNVFINPFINER